MRDRLAGVVGQIDASCKPYRRTALKLKPCLVFLSLISLVSTSYAETGLSQVAGVWRLSLPRSLTPLELVVSPTERAGDAGCAGQKVWDVVFKFGGENKASAEDPAWVKFADQKKRGAFCEFVAQPGSSGDLEVHVSFPAKSGGTIKTLSFQTSDEYVVDVWREASEVKKKVALKSLKKETKTTSPTAKTSARAALVGVGVFDDEDAWTKALGVSVRAFDLNTPELNRFRLANPDAKTPEILQPKFSRLHLPLLNLPFVDQRIDFDAEPLKLKTFSAEDLSAEEASEVERKSLLDSLNLITLFAERGDWLKAQRSADILEQSKLSKFIPKNQAKWWFLKGLVDVRLGQQLKNIDLSNRGMDLWRDGIRLGASQGGSNHSFVEYMVVESLRHLLSQNLLYAALSMLTWSDRYAWSTRLEERFSYLKGEAYFRLGLMDESRKQFETFLTDRKNTSINAMNDRRLFGSATFRIGDTYYVQHRFNEAIVAYQQAFQNDKFSKRFTFEGVWFPEELRFDPHALFNRAESYVRLRKFSEALRDLRAFLFVSENHPEAGLVYYRIGDLLAEMDAPEEKVLGAWRECVYKAKGSLGARLCEARQAARELTSAKNKLVWPRIIARVEDSAPKPKALSNKIFELPDDDQRSYLELLLADSFLRLEEPGQAQLRLEPTVKLDPSSYLSLWLLEYRITSLQGVMHKKIEEKKYREVVALYDRFRFGLFMDTERPEVLYSVASAYVGLGLWDQAKKTVDIATEVRKTFRRNEERPYDVSDVMWSRIRAQVLLELLDKKLASEGDVALAMAALPKVEKSVDPQDLRLWLRFYQLKEALGDEAGVWKQLEGAATMSWSEVQRNSQILKTLKRDNERADLLNRRVGAWFGEREKLKDAGTPPVELLFDLFEVRAEAANQKPDQGEAAIAVADYLLGVLPKDPTQSLTKPLIAYRKGLVLVKLGRFSDARRSFGAAIQVAPDSVWGKLASSAQKEIEGK